jgi:hypothetical protein
MELSDLHAFQKIKSTIIKRNIAVANVYPPIKISRYIKGSPAPENPIM